MTTVTNDKDQCPIIRPAVILPDESAAEIAVNEVQHFSAALVLADSELRNELPTNSCSRVPLDSYMKLPSPSTKPAMYASSLSC